MPSTVCKGFALIDCNNFFVSCERVFKPHLNFLPVAVLSTNDGCIIARSQEVKDLGVPMGAPLFEYKNLLERHKAYLFSSNFNLYADFSDRVMQVISQFSSDLEIYSIDEAFVPIDCQTLEDFRYLKERIFQWTGIPVSIGLGPTKTLAKVAAHKAKKMNDKLYSLMDPKTHDAILKTIPIRDIWGIGRAQNKKLHSHQIITAYDLKVASEGWIRRKLHLPGLRTVLELRGTPCYVPEVNDSKRKSLIYSKSFGSSITSYEHLSEAVAHYAAKAALKIRNKGYSAHLLTLYLKRRDGFATQTASLSFPSNSTSIYIETSLKLLKQLYIKGVYLKAGIQLNQLASQKNIQLDLTHSENQSQKELMKTLDAVNQRYGENTLFYAAEGFSRSWSCKAKHKTPDYTTNWNDILRVKMDAL
ncbi:MAG: Protein UmuC [Chlamydiae bacterium]|nr:Protein UmuC [Chlamydiota bacterium]